MTPLVMRLMRTIGVSPIGVEDGVADLLHESSLYCARPHADVCIAAPTVVAAAGTKPKKIEEFAGRVNSGHAQVSVARMTSPSGWQEPGQRPEFEEITVVLRGMVRVEHDGGVARRARRPGGRHRARRVGALQHAGRRRRGVRRRLPAGVLARHRSSRRIESRRMRRNNRVSADPRVHNSAACSASSAFNSVIARRRRR